MIANLAVKRCILMYIDSAGETEVEKVWWEVRK